MDGCVGISETQALMAHTRDAIDAGNFAYFSGIPAGQQAKIASIFIDGKFYILHYAAMRNQTAIFSHLVDAKAGWGTHTKSGLKTHGNLILASAFGRENIPIIQVVISNLEAKVSDARWPKIRNFPSHLFSHIDDQQSILFFLSKYGPKSPLSKPFYATCFQELKLTKPRPQKIESKSKEEKVADMWVDSVGNTPLHHAAKASNLIALQFYIEELHVSPLIKNQNKKNAFDMIPAGSNALPLREYAAQWKERHKQMLAFLSCRKTEYKDVKGNGVPKLPDVLFNEIFYLAFGKKK